MKKPKTRRQIEAYDKKLEAALVQAMAKGLNDFFASQEGRDLSFGEKAEAVVKKDERRKDTYVDIAVGDGLHTFTASLVVE